MWFGHLDTLDKDQYQNIKSEMDMLTFHGTLREQNDLVNGLIKFEDSRLIFDTVVRNNSHRLCLLPEECSSLFNKFGLVPNKL